MNKIVLSFPDVTKKCQQICHDYDREISELIMSNKHVPIDVLLEGPALVLTELFEEGQDKNVKRLVYSILWR